MTENKGRQEHVFADNVLDVVFAYRDDSSFCTNHWHDSIEIIYILKGCTEVFIDQKKYSIMPGEIMVINSGVVHASQTMGNNAIFMQIPIELPGRYIPNIKDVYFDVPLHTDDKVKNIQLDSMKKLMRQMYHVAYGKEDGYAIKFAGLLYEFIYEMYVAFAIKRPKKRAAMDVTEETERLTKIVDYTNEHYKENITIAEISAQVHLQPEYFCRYFKKYMGLTYVEYLNELRLSYIYEDLLYTDFPLYKILESHGFKNYKLFRRMFRDRYDGETPMHVREKYQKRMHQAIQNVERENI